ncbi:MAG: glycine dehydrogenase, partial [Bacilli bacterium]|nr:glycine dehydrogenase [Bacilli bacterium]
MHKYLPQTNKDIEEMLNRIGVKNVQQLFLDVPKEIIDKDKIDIPSHKSEQEIYSYFKDIASKNIPLKIFAGGGAYDHY